MPADPSPEQKALEAIAAKLGGECRGPTDLYPTAGCIAVWPDAPKYWCPWCAFTVATASVALAASALSGEGERPPAKYGAQEVGLSYCWHYRLVIQNDLSVDGDSIDHYDPENPCPGPHGIMWAAR